MSHVPGYVFVILAVLIYIGVKRCMPREVKPERLLLFPLLIVASGFNSMAALFAHAAPTSWAGAVMTGAIGLAAGWHHAQGWRLSFNADGSRVRLPGDPSLLIIILFTFGFEFVLHFALAAHLTWMTSPLFAPVSLGVWGLLAGMPAGRAINVLVRSQQSMSVRTLGSGAAQ
ncbi:hypothetical protein [Silvimonas amylolytica]|uniref:DUF1453 domain-containing protein n=1 Tax=Silvimonas amylolytica TaxID=449663 RepID=A0ABQ2PND6_9NEIS|nr:hypothetical protein [Silvimonas amylolytica]GGP26890.1 hypothetical protein GCM10010971_27090 [Silvimonas amylolytica]